jgi:drug/metabolite transporter (DMT)-like permease
MHFSSRTVAAIGIGTSVVLWASAFTGIRATLASFGPTDIAFLRVAIASASIFACCLLARVRFPAWKSIPRTAAAGLVGIALYNLLLNHGELSVSAGAAGFLGASTPIFALLLGVLLGGERVRIWGIAAVALSFLGIFIIAAGKPGDFTIDQSALLVIAAAFCLALSFVIQRPLLSTASPLAVNATMMAFAALVLAPFAPAAVRAVTLAPAEAIAAVVYLGLGPSMLAYVTWSFALSHYPVGKASSFLNLAPIVTLITSYFWLGEIPSFLTVLGGAITIGGVFMANARGRRAPTTGTDGGRMAPVVVHRPHAHTQKGD